MSWPCQGRNQENERFFGRATQEARTAFGIKGTQLKQSNPLAAEFSEITTGSRSSAKDERSIGGIRPLAFQL